ncbi:hypothetical protein THRCLA_07314 [Thraustotheca clavata]|uniref:Transmembrane protein n=1 Tax=Thraustotheca clavata TaxID=74557 RepID=A0A1V9ZES8_9STRA|nr:hypothetical protein THRCLA_07314 [Thraustotheca clavata]
MSVRYEFDGESTGGIKGYIKVVRSNERPGASLQAHLDLSALDIDAIKAFDDNCKDEPIAAFKWHIHTKWHRSSSMGFLKGCSLENAGNHYDPDFACGPNSEHIKDDKCKDVKYTCNPQAYRKNPKVCERGDLSGKLGEMQVVDGVIAHTWYDAYYPSMQEETPHWNMLLHAVCKNTTPRIACAIATPSTNYDGTYASWVIVAVLIAALLGLHHVRHPILFKYYPTNVVVAAVVGILGLLVYQYFVIDSTI